MYLATASTEVAIQCRRIPFQAKFSALEKVRAHDVHAVEVVHPKAVGNDVADAAARRTATAPGVPHFTVDISPFGDPVELVDGGGSVVHDVGLALAQLWWERRQVSRSRRRPWLDKLYPPPPDVSLDWPLSTGCFSRPQVTGRAFVHSSPNPVVKWLARARAGCLASRLRLFSHGMGRRWIARAVLPPRRMKSTW